jgi:diadenosine tetraphosphatase ApaH/serine/threonine PP2A family protein phosphatase
MRFFIGDVHGCADEYQQMLKEIFKRDHNPAIFSVGDLINKGPDTLGVLHLTLENKVKAILGNHEVWYLKIVKDPSLIRKGKDERLMSAFKGVEQLWAKRISEWPLFREFPDLDLVHAGLDPRKQKLAEMDQSILTTIRTWDGLGLNLNRQSQDPAWFKETKWPKKVVFGHWAQMGLVRYKNYLGLDTGCVYGRKLSCWCPESGELFQVKAKRIYCSP